MDEMMKDFYGLKAREVWRALPRVIRWFLVTLLIMVILGGGVYAYVALTATGEVTVQECLSLVGPNTFSVSLYPLESKTVSLTVANASSQAIDVDLLSTVIPDPGTKGLTIDIPSKLVAPAGGQVTITVIITAGKSAVPQVYSLTIEIVR